MNGKRFSLLLLLWGVLWLGCRPEARPEQREFAVQGTVREVRPRSLVVAHEAIPGFMPAMTMEFALRDAQTNGLRAGSTIKFRLCVTESESWITRIEVVGSAVAAAPAPAAPMAADRNLPARFGQLIADVIFTNQAGREVRWADLDGQAVGLTFFFTRCPLPEYCPRLAKNFSGASRRLAAMPEAPTNWHLVSLTFDPEFDSPAVLRAYGAGYGADSRRWSFWATSVSNTARIAQLFGLGYTRRDGTIDHDFRTAVFDAGGRLQSLWPVGGDTTDMLVTELIKAARTNGVP